MKKEEQQGDILLLVRNFTWTEFPETKRFGQIKFLNQNWEKGQKRSQLVSIANFPRAPEKFQFKDNK